MDRADEGPPAQPVTGSRGAHALTRSPALGLLRPCCGPDTCATVIRGTAALTHGAPDTQDAAVGAARLVAHRLTESDPFRAWTDSRPGDDHPTDTLVRSLPMPHSASPDTVLDLLKAPGGVPDHGQLAWMAPDATASSALLGALLVVSRFPGPTPWAPPCSSRPARRTATRWRPPPVHCSVPRTASTRCPSSC
ncbi:ADP-ribosylglycohydrolase family protein [Kitasatospora sp. NPDC059599]|uniref:ADP-ribosylglycohydrolase family protein n=1 Tax=Kitasatospora sp. NPDC059599 TaxID=3346880 RepID=UPI00367A8907